jgi:hypothetical protein
MVAHQSPSMSLALRYREQARSHKGDKVIFGNVAGTSNPTELKTKPQGQPFDPIALNPEIEDD